MEFVLALGVLSTGFSLLAVVCALRALTMRPTPAKRLDALEIDVTELDDRVAQLFDSFKRLRSRQNMRDLRERRRSEDPGKENDFSESESTPVPVSADSPHQLPGETAADWKKRVRVLMSTGKLSTR